MTERCLEIAIAKIWLKKNKPKNYKKNYKVNFYNIGKRFFYEFYNYKTLNTIKRSNQ